MSLSTLTSHLPVSLPTLIATLVGSGTFWIWWKAFRVPRALRHLPTMPIVPNLYYQVMELGFEKRFEKTCRPYQRGPPLSLEWIPPMGWTVSVSDLANFRFIMQDVEAFRKVLLSDFVPGRLAHIFFGENILFSNGHDWQFFRRTCTPAFKHGWNLQVFEQTIQRLIDQWNKLGSEPISVGPWFERYALDSLGLSIFTTEFGSILDANSPFAVLYRTIMENILRFKYLLFNKLDFRANPYRKPIYDMVDDFDRLFYGLIQERREAKARGDVLPRDLLTSFLEEHKSVDEAGAKILRVMTDKELRDNLSAFILAGHDTAMVSLSTAMYLLGMDQSVQSKARQAVLEAIGGSEGAETLMHIPYLDAVIRETLRLYPPAARLMERTTTKDVMMPSGDLLPKGTHVIGNLYAIHRDPAVWGEDVEEYKPERHLTPDGQEMTSASSNSFVAFASGPRTCLGMTFAMAEMRVALARLLQSFTWTSVPNASKGPNFGVSYLLVPENMDIIVTRRNE